MHAYRVAQLRGCLPPWRQSNCGTGCELRPQDAGDRTQAPRMMFCSHCGIALSVSWKVGGALLGLAIDRVHACILALALLRSQPSMLRLFIASLLLRCAVDAGTSSKRATNRSWGGRCILVATFSAAMDAWSAGRASVRRLFHNSL